MDLCTSAHAQCGQKPVVYKLLCKRLTSLELSQCISTCSSGWWSSHTLLSLNYIVVLGNWSGLPLPGLLPHYRPVVGVRVFPSWIYNFLIIDTLLHGCLLFHLPNAYRHSIIYQAHLPSLDISEYISTCSSGWWSSHTLLSLNYIVVHGNCLGLSLPGFIHHPRPVVGARVFPSWTYNFLIIDSLLHGCLLFQSPNDYRHSIINLLAIFSKQVLHWAASYARRVKLCWRAACLTTTVPPGNSIVMRVLRQKRDIFIECYKWYTLFWMFIVFTTGVGISRRLPSCWLYRERAIMAAADGDWYRIYVLE